jgi:hypothetical protein
VASAARAAAGRFFLASSGISGTTTTTAAATQGQSIKGATEVRRSRSCTPGNGERRCRIGHPGFSSSGSLTFLALRDRRRYSACPCGGRLKGERGLRRGRCGPLPPVAACVPRFEMRGSPVLTPSVCPRVVQRLLEPGCTSRGTVCLPQTGGLPALRLHVLAAIGERPRVFSLWNFQIPRQSENTPVVGKACKCR